MMTRWRRFDLREAGGNYDCRMPTIDSERSLLASYFTDRCTRETAIRRQPLFDASLGSRQCRSYIAYAAIRNRLFRDNTMNDVYHSKASPQLHLFDFAGIAGREEYRIHILRFICHDVTPSPAPAQISHSASSSLSGWPCLSTIEVSFLRQ
jgi:hypothetical protein